MYVVDRMNRLVGVDRRRRGGPGRTRGFPLRPRQVGRLAAGRGAVVMVVLLLWKVVVGQSFAATNPPFVFSHAVLRGVRTRLRRGAWIEPLLLLLLMMLVRAFPPAH